MTVLQWALLHINTCPFLASQQKISEMRNERGVDNKIQQTTSKSSIRELKLSAENEKV